MHIYIFIFLIKYTTSSHCKVLSNPQIPIFLPSRLLKLCKFPSNCFCCLVLFNIVWEVLKPSHNLFGELSTVFECVSILTILD